MSDRESLRGCALYFDCFAGIAGDMTLGALLDLGVPEEVVYAELSKLPLGGYRLWHERVQRGALMGVKAHVDLDLEGAGETPRRDHAHDHTPARAHAHEHPHTHEHVHTGEHSHTHEHVHAGEHSHPHEAPHAHDPPHHGEHPHDRGAKHVHAEHAHTHYRDIRQMLTGSLEGDVRARALAIFDRIAVVEARLHGVTVDDVAFHEVGAVDSIVDIVGAAAALAWLRPTQVTARRVPLGGGFVNTAHGRLAVPAPATLELLLGADVESGGDSELTTPTGAAILAATVTSYGPMPPLTVAAVGWGAGDRQLADRPNLLRVVAGHPAKVEGLNDLPVVIEANVDDMNPEWCEPLVEALFSAGALDVWLQPILMKKGRPALKVSALCDAPRREAVSEAILRESTTLGVRYYPVSRTTLERRFVEVETPYGKVPIKVAGKDGEVMNAAPEYEVCRQLAREHQVAVKLVYLAALGAFQASIEWR